MNIDSLFKEFFRSEKAGGLILIIVTSLSLIIANTAWQIPFTGFWQYKTGGLSLVNWINDGLMTIFFFLIGLELKREIYTGELSDIKNASLPFFAALGGMLVPVGIFFLLNSGTEYLPGAGIPMATDIAFAIGILSLLGGKVPNSLKIFLTAFAVIDDLGAIIIIAIFYTSSLIVFNLLASLGIFFILVILNRMKVSNLVPYISGGLAMWYFMLHSGIHPTISGVLLAFVIPFGDGRGKSPSFKLQAYLHKPVAFFILPLFAIANTCIPIDGKLFEGLGQSFSVGIISGLVIGKPAGIILFSFIAVALGLSSLPAGLRWKDIAGAGILGGIGFTMSIFVTFLAFNDPNLINTSKISILLASLVAGATGFIWLSFALKKNSG